MAVRRTTRKALVHPQVGRLDLHCDVVLSVASGQRLVLFRAQRGTDTSDRTEVLRITGPQDLQAAYATG